jgi:hypothetical protein
MSKSTKGMLAPLGLALVLVFGAAFSCGQPHNQGRIANPAPSPDDRGSQPMRTMTDDLSNLPGTDWSVLPYKTMPDIFAFCPSGRWELQGSAAFGGRYRIAVNHIVMNLDDGSLYANCSLSSRKGDEIYLACGDTDLHLKYHGKVNCE